MKPHHAAWLTAALLAAAPVAAQTTRAAPDASAAPRVSPFPEPATTAASSPTTGDPLIPPDWWRLGGLARGVGSGLIVRGRPYGNADTGCLICVMVSDAPLAGTARAGINGDATGGGVSIADMARYGSLDSVGLYEEAGSTAPYLVLTNVKYDATHIYPAAGTTFTAVQLAQLRRNMWVVTNSIDPAIAVAPATSDIGFIRAAPMRVFVGVVQTWSPDAIVVGGWTVPGSGRTAAGQVPSAASPQTASFGAPTSQFGRNLVMRYDPTIPGQMLTDEEGEELDMFHAGTIDGAVLFRGYTCQYQPLGKSVATGGPVLPATGSWCYYGGGQMPHIFVADELATSDSFRSNAALINGNQSPAAAVGSRHMMREQDNYSDGNNLRMLEWAQRDVASIAGWQSVSVHLGLFVDGRANDGFHGRGTFDGSPMGQIVINPKAADGAAQNSGAVAILGSTGAGITVTGGGALVTTPSTPASSKAPCSVGTITTDAAYLYVCVAANTWKRATLSAF